MTTMEFQQELDQLNKLIETYRLEASIKQLCMTTELNKNSFQLKQQYLESMKKADLLQENLLLKKILIEKMIEANEKTQALKTISLDPKSNKKVFQLF